MACKAGLRDGSPQLCCQTAAVCISILVWLPAPPVPRFMGEHCCLLAACRLPLQPPREDTLPQAAPPDRQHQK